MEVEIYSKTNCIFCDKAKIRLAKENPKIHMLDKDYSRDKSYQDDTYRQSDQNVSK